MQLLSNQLANHVWTITCLLQTISVFDSCLQNQTKLLHRDAWYLTTSMVLDKLIKGKHLSNSIRFEVPNWAASFYYCSILNGEAAAVTDLNILLSRLYPLRVLLELLCGCTSFKNHESKSHFVLALFSLFCSVCDCGPVGFCWVLVFFHGPEGTYSVSKWGKWP